MVKQNQMDILMKEKRQRQVDQTNANMRLAGFEPDADQGELHRRYVAGEITIQDMLDWNSAMQRNMQRQGGQIIPTPKDAH